MERHYRRPPTRTPAAALALGTEHDHGTCGGLGDSAASRAGARRPPSGQPRASPPEGGPGGTSGDPADPADPTASGGVTSAADPGIAIADTTAPAAMSPAHASIATGCASARTSGSDSPAPTPATRGSTATASSPATRATALLVADATPARWSGAAASAVAVSGATVSTRPTPTSRTPGSTSSR